MSGVLQDITKINSYILSKKKIDYIKNRRVSGVGELLQPFMQNKILTFESVEGTQCLSVLMCICEWVPEGLHSHAEMLTSVGSRWKFAMGYPYHKCLADCSEETTIIGRYVIYRRE